MAGSVNKVIIIGNLGQDPEVRSFPNGGKVCIFSVATSENWKDRNTGERREKTEWHRVAVFSQGLVTIIKNYVKKGTKLYIEGAIQSRKWTDNQGVEKTTTEIVLQNYNSTLQILDARERGSNNDNYSSNSNSEYVDINQGDIILHNRFGKGEVVNTEGIGSDKKAEVDFEISGLKNILLKFAKYEKVN